MFYALHYSCHIDHRLWDTILLLYLWSSTWTHSCYFPHASGVLGLWSTSQFGSCRVKLIPEVWSYFRYMLLKVIPDLLCMLYNLCIVHWYYPLFAAICEIWLLRLTYGAYLVLSRKLVITIIYVTLIIRLWDLYNLVVILVEFDMDSLLLFPPHLRRSLGLWSTSQFGSCIVKLILEV